MSMDLSHWPKIVARRWQTNGLGLRGRRRRLTDRVHRLTRAAINARCRCPVQLTIRPIDSKADRKTFVDLPFRLYADDPNWVPPLKGEALGLITPEKNGWFSHAKAQLFLAERDGQVVGRISAHIDTLALTMPAEQGFGPGCGQWGLYRRRGRGHRHGADRHRRGLAARARA